MGLLSQLLVLLISLTGIIFGIILAKIAPEELSAGKKLFLIIKRTLFILIFFLVNYYLIQKIFIIIPFTILMIILFVMELKTNNILYEIATYLLFIIPYFFIAEQSIQLLLASLIFLYGLPTGTLLKK